MNQKSFKAIFLMVVLVISTFVMLNGQTASSAEELLKKNIEAVGGREKLEKIRNFSFKAGSNRYYVLPDGTMKLLVGTIEPVVIAATLVTQDIVKENFFHQIQTVEGTEKSRLQCLARLTSGFFSLALFEGALSYQGMKSFGPERHHLISTKACGLEVAFSVDAETYLVRTMTLKKYSPEERHFEISYEFGFPMEVMGFKIPSSIFFAPVGTQSSTNPSPMEISDVKINLELDDQFFSQIEVNVGEVTVAEGLLKGNVLDIMVFPPRPSFVVVTNWRREDVEKAGLKTGEKLMLSLDGIESELTFDLSYSESGNVGYNMPDARFMSMDPLRGSFYFIYFNLLNKEEAERIKSRLAPLLPIQLQKKAILKRPKELK